MFAGACNHSGVYAQVSWVWQHCQYLIIGSFFFKPICTYSSGHFRGTLWCGLLRHWSPKQRSVQWKEEAVWQLLSHHSHDWRLQGLLQQWVFHLYTQNRVHGLPARRWGTSSREHEQEYSTDSGRPGKTWCPLTTLRRLIFTFFN